MNMMKEQKEIPMKTESTTLSGNFDNTKTCHIRHTTKMNKKGKETSVKTEKANHRCETRQHQTCHIRHTAKKLELILAEFTFYFITP